MSQPQTLLETKNLTKHFVTKRSFLGEPLATVRAVEGVNLTVEKGKTLGLVGETGCGKTTVGRTIVGLYNPTGGEVLLNGENVHATLAGPSAMTIRRKMQMIFQDPYSSLNPRMTVGDIIREPMEIHHLASQAEMKERVWDLLKQVGLNPEHASRFPHEFSGGQRQRVGIARALAVNPEFILCDEPISALDVSIQAQVVNLLEELQAKLGLTYIFIAHDLSMVKHISQRVAVMYLGSVAEIAPSLHLYDNPLHPYTQALLSAIPIADPKLEKSRKRILLEGDIPSPLNPPSGCKFRTRCRKAFDRCAEEIPVLKEVEPGHQVACHLVG
ncbi:MAG TPA: ATP-binding cassette domain-containing protein [Selenomonadales bacterium]|nr:ATP-binding cassette domain-containing protein [Selenomonadales bacterium]